MARELAIFATKKADKAPSLKVEGIPVRAMDIGYIKGSIVPDGTEFLFSGNIVKRRLPYWLEETKPGTLDAYLNKHYPLEEKKVLESKAPAASAAPTDFASAGGAPAGNASDVLKNDVSVPASLV